MVIRDSDSDKNDRKKPTNGDYRAVAVRRENVDTIKLNPITLNRLKQWHFGNRSSLPETITYDELFNILLDRVEEKQKSLISSLS